MENNAFNPEQEESKLAKLIDDVGQGKESARYRLGQELCSLSQSNLETVVKDWHKNYNLSVERGANGKITALNFPYIDTDMFAQVNTCSDKRLPNGATVEETPETRITRAANGLALTIESTQGQFKDFKAEYQVQIDDNGLPKDAKITSKWPDGRTETNTVSKEDFDSILFERGDTLAFFKANEKWDFALQGRAGSLITNPEKEAQMVADLFSDIGPTEFGGLGYKTAVRSGTERLSADLQQLWQSKDIAAYNKLLQDVHNKIPDEPVMTPSVDFGHYDKNTHKWDDSVSPRTGTWDKAAVTVFEMDESGAGVGKTAYRIVQPGNTLSEIARDDLSSKAAHGEKPSRTVAEHVKYLRTLNDIPDPNVIHVGQAIKLLEGY